MSQNTSPLGLPVTVPKVTCQYACDEPAAFIMQRHRPCGHRVMPDIMACVGHAKEFGNSNAKNASRCGFRGGHRCLATNHIRMSVPRPI